MTGNSKEINYAKLVWMFYIDEWNNCVYLTRCINIVWWKGISMKDKII